MVMGLAERVAHKFLLRGAGSLPLWSVLSGLKRALSGLEHGKIYDNLKQVADLVGSLGRVGGLDPVTVREGVNLSHRIVAAEKSLLGVMIDVQNFFVVLEHTEETVAEMPEKYASSGYGPHFHKLVECVDALDEGQKKISQAKAALEQIKKLIARDPDVAGLPGLDKHAPAQHVESLERDLAKVEEAVWNLTWQYDESNKAFLRMGLK